MARKKFQTLTEQMYYILLSLNEEKCGVDICAYIRTLTHNRVLIGPGTLYTLLLDFEQEGLIKVTKIEGRKKSYIITDTGREMLKKEYKRLQRQVEAGAGLLEENNEKQ
ncbi:MAG: PadR family transcriptional regulator [Eubacteriales bacterium]|nr:PadR family transcriptional regulator [Eubacteriales bacterium]